MGNCVTCSAVASSSLPPPTVAPLCGKTQDGICWAGFVVACIRSMVGEELLIEWELYDVRSRRLVGKAAAHGRSTERQNARWHLLGRVCCHMQGCLLTEEMLTEFELSDLLSRRLVFNTAGHC